MKKHLLIVVAILISVPMWAQLPFTMSPNDTIETDISSNAYTELMIEQINVSGEAITLGIQVVHNDIPETWDGMVCLQGVCLGVIPPIGTTSQMMTISGTMNGYVRLTANPMGGSESAKLQIRVFDMANPSEFETATWIVHSALLDVDELESSIRLETYPNPTRDIVHISSSDNFDEINIYGMDGKLLLNEIVHASANQKISISHLPAGMYNLEVLKANTRIGANKIVKYE